MSALERADTPDGEAADNSAAPLLTITGGISTTRRPTPFAALVSADCSVALCPGNRDNLSEPGSDVSVVSNVDVIPEGYRRNGTVDWRHGARTHDKPVAFQARSAGPALLFLTDIRMSVLVTLAMSPTPYRMKRLEELLGKANLSPCIEELVSSGLLASWYAGRCHRLVALDPCHPCFESLSILLRRIGKTYDFPRPLYLSENLFAGAAPKRLSRARDARLTFGHADRTLTLLAIFVLVRASINDVTRALAFFDRRLLSRTLWRLHAFGVLKSDAVGGSAGAFFELDPDFEFAAEVHGVLQEVARKLPVWVRVLEDYRTAPRECVHRKRPNRKSGGSNIAFRQWSLADRRRRKAKRE